MTVTQAVNLYKPTDAEITGVLSSARTSRPTLASRIGRSEEILLAGGVTVDAVAWQGRNVVRWHVTSQSKPCDYYVIPSGQNCTCLDRAQRIGETRFCKHSVCIAAYLRILRDKLQSDIRTFNVELSMLHTGQLHAFAPRLGMVMLEKDNGVYKFVNATYAIHYSTWLARQQAMNWLTNGIAADVREMVTAAA